MSETSTNDSQWPPADLAERNRQALESRGVNATLHFAFHDTEVSCVRHYEDGLFYYPRYVQRRDVEDEHWMVLYEAENGAEYISTLNDFFGYVQVGDERVGRFTVVTSAPPQRRPRTPSR